MPHGRDLKDHRFELRAIRQKTCRGLQQRAQDCVLQCQLSALKMYLQGGDRYHVSDMYSTSSDVAQNVFYLHRMQEGAGY
jgi:hypothetical protein